MAINAERYTVILDNALEGAGMAAGEIAEDGDPAMLLRADTALKRGASLVVELRNAVCSKGLVSGEACKLPAWPSWTLEPPTAATSPAELVRRTDWLSRVMAPFAEAGCKAGEKANQDPGFCSVE